MRNSWALGFQRLLFILGNNPGLTPNFLYHVHHSAVELFATSRPVGILHRCNHKSEKSLEKLSICFIQDWGVWSKSEYRIRKASSFKMKPWYPNHQDHTSGEPLTWRSLWIALVPIATSYALLCIYLIPFIDTWLPIFKIFCVGVLFKTN